MWWIQWSISDFRRLFIWWRTFLERSRPSWVSEPTLQQDLSLSEPSNALVNMTTLFGPVNWLSRIWSLWHMSTRQNVFVISLFPPTTRLCCEENSGCQFVVVVCSPTSWSSRLYCRYYNWRRQPLGENRKADMCNNCDYEMHASASCMRLPVRHVYKP